MTADRSRVQVAGSTSADSRKTAPVPTAGRGRYHCLGMILAPRRGSVRTVVAVTVTDQGLVLRTVPYTSPDAQRLVAAALADLGQRYGGSGDETPVDPREFSPPEGVFVVAYLDGVAVGCGGWRTRDDDAEIKRMYTVPEARGRGVAQAVLALLETSAHAAGRRQMILEAGSRQPEAIRLYEARGYRRIPNFGYYKDAPGAMSYGFELPTIESPGNG